MSTTAEKKLNNAKKNLVERGNFNEVFWDIAKEETICGIYKGRITKKIDNEEREFAIIAVEGAEKPYICGGRDLLNKLTEADLDCYVEITFQGKETFTPKGTKKKVPINRFKVLVEAVEDSK